MQRLEGRFVYSASDLNSYLDCKRLVELDSLVALGKLVRPETKNEQAELLQRKGEAHEAAHVQELREFYAGQEIATFEERPENSLDGYVRAEAATLEAMRSGVPVIYQATFFDGTFVGRADFLRRVESPSDLG